MTVHIDKVRYQRAGEPSSDVRELPERADDQQTLFIYLLVKPRKSSDKTKQYKIE